MFTVFTLRGKKGEYTDVEVSRFHNAAEKLLE